MVVGWSILDVLTHYLSRLTEQVVTNCCRLCTGRFQNKGAVTRNRKEKGLESRL